MGKYISNMLSVVVPVYYGEATVQTLCTRVFASVENIFDEVEIILVNDASPDNSWEIIKNLTDADKRVIGLNFSRNFGQHYAITAGLEHCRGEWIVVMDCDLQDMPEEIPKLYYEAIKGYDSVFAQRKVRYDSFLKKMSSKMFYLCFSYLTNTRQDASIANFGIYNFKVIQAVLEMKDHIRYFPAMTQWVGFNKCYMPVQHAERGAGKSSYSLFKLFKLAFDSIICFSDKPLRLTANLGMLISMFSALTAIYFLVLYWQGKIEVLGFASLILSIWFLSGIIIFILGIQGIYLGKTFDRVKSRPIYIVKDRLNADK